MLEGYATRLALKKWGPGLREQLETLSQEEFAAQAYTLHAQVFPWLDETAIPTFPEFVASPRYLGESPLSDRQRRVFEQSIGLHARDWFVTPRKISTLWLCWGKGSGKDLLSAEVLAYTAYCIARMRNPWLVFGQPFGEVMDCINVAQDKNAAQDNFYARFQRMVRRPCFAGLLNQKDAKSGGDIAADATDFYTNIAGYDYPVLVMRVHSLHSKNEAAEGKNTLFWVMDEADALKTAENDAAGRMMFRTLRTSNRFFWRQLGIVISYPRADNGFMFWGLRQCGNRNGPAEEWWGDLAPTWQVLPWKSYEPVEWRGKIHDADPIMAQLYRDDPEDFWATYGCRPPAVEGAFIANPEKIGEATEAAEDACLEPIAEVEPSRTVRRTDDNKEHQFVSLAISNIRFRQGVTYFLAGDAGTTHDSFALCVAHMVPPGERGFICPRCWGIGQRRYAKHYRAVPVPARWPSGPYLSPVDWRCDFDGLGGKRCETPDSAKHRFWGLVDRSGVSVQQLRVARVTKAGEPVAALDTEGNEVLEDGWLPLVVEDLLLEWRPDKRRQLTVDYLNVRDVIWQLKDAARAQGARFGMMRFDKWQAESIIQDILASGIMAEGKQMSNPEQLAIYRNYKRLLNNNLVWLLPDQDGYPHLRARQQLRELILVNASKIDHPKVSGYGGPGAKDLTDAEAIAFALAVSWHAKGGFIDSGSDAEGRDYLDAAGKALQAKENPRGYTIVGDALSSLGRW